MQTKMASTEDAFVPPRDHSTPKQTPKVFGCENEEHRERKSLQNLQCSAFDDKSFVGISGPHSTPRSEKNGEKNKHFKPVPGPVKVFHDKGSPRKKEKKLVETRETQTDSSWLEDLVQERIKQGEKRNRSSVDSDEDAHELMTKDTVPEAYWKELAEQRRIALSDTLEENKSLHQEVDSLREENERLSLVVSQAENLSALLMSVVSDDEDEDEGKEKKDGEQDRCGPKEDEKRTAEGEVEKTAESSKTEALAHTKDTKEKAEKDETELEKDSKTDTESPIHSHEEDKASVKKCGDGECTENELCVWCQ